MMRRWAKWGGPSGACTPDFCNYRINIVQTLPPFLAGTPDSSARSWLPKIAQDLGLRSTAAHAGFTFERGAVSTKWFGEQVTLPVQDWSLSSKYIPYLSVLSGESYKFRGRAKTLRNRIPTGPFCTQTATWSSVLPRRRTPPSGPR